MTIEQPVKITIRPLEPDAYAQPGALLVAGQVVVPSDYRPVHEACRRLTHLGYDGPVEVQMEGEPSPYLLIEEPQKVAQSLESVGRYLVSNTLSYFPFGREVYIREPAPRHD